MQQMTNSLHQGAMMVCRMFDESNGRSNFDVATVGIDPVYAMPLSASAKGDPSIGRCNHPPPPVLPHEDTVLAMLRREKWLRLRPQVQDAVSWPGMNGTRMNALIQVRVAHELLNRLREMLCNRRRACQVHVLFLAQEGEIEIHIQPPPVGIRRVCSARVEGGS